MKHKKFISLILLLMSGLSAFILSVPVNSAPLYQSLTTVNCTSVDITSGLSRYPNNTISFAGVYFATENEITVEEVRLALFRADATSNNSTRLGIYEVTGVPSTLGLGQPTVVATSPEPLWSTTIAKGSLPLYSSFTSAQRGDPSNWYAAGSIAGVTFEAGHSYALLVYSTGDHNTSFSTQIALGFDSSGACGIENVMVSGSGASYTATSTIPTGNITAGASGCDFSAWAFPCSSISGANRSVGFAIYGVEIFPEDTEGTILSWADNFLDSMGMNSQFGKVFVGSLFAICIFLLLSSRGVPWILSLGLTGIAATVLTVLTLFDPAILLALVAIVMVAGMGLIISLVFGKGGE